MRILNKEIQCPAEVKAIVENIREYKQGFGSCAFRFVQQSANVVADKLPHFGMRGHGMKIWKARSPNWLLSSQEHDNYLYKLLQWFFLITFVTILTKNNNNNNKLLCAIAVANAHFPRLTGEI